jgi:hypothetical protein
MSGQAAASYGKRPSEKEPLVYHGVVHPISAAFAMRYAHTLMRMWAVSGFLADPRLQNRHSAAGDGIWGVWGFENQIRLARRRDLP